jgi:NTE family protein
MPSIRSIARRKPRVAFVLSGGGNLGAIQVGMLRALWEREIHADVVLGCSVGALNGGAWAAEPTGYGLANLERAWRSMTSHDLMPSSRIPGALQLVRKGEALYANTGLRSSIEAFLGHRSTFEELVLPFECVATDVDLATEHWFSTGPIVEPILASAALPSVYPIVKLGGRRYLDGGVVDNVPIGRAVELGAKKIYVLHVGLHGRPNAQVKRPLDAALMAYWIARNHRFARDLAGLPKSVEAIVLPPGDRPDLRYDDFTQTGELIDQGYQSAAAYLDELTAAEQNEPGLAERLRLDAFKTAEWRRVIDRRRGADEDVADEVEPDDELGDGADRPIVEASLGETEDAHDAAGADR